MTSTESGKEMGWGTRFTVWKCGL